LGNSIISTIEHCPFYTVLKNYTSENNLNLFLAHVNHTNWRDLPFFQNVVAEKKIKLEIQNISNNEITLQMEHLFRKYNNSLDIYSLERNNICIEANGRYSSLHGTLLIIHKQNINKVYVEVLVVIESRRGIGKMVVKSLLNCYKYLSCECTISSILFWYKMKIFPVNKNILYQLEKIIKESISNIWIDRRSLKVSEWVSLFDCPSTYSRKRPSIVPSTILCSNE